MEKKNKFVEFITRSFGAVSKYVIGKSISCTIIVLVAGFTLKALGVKGAFWIGAIMGIGNLIPIFGVWVGIAISVIIVLIQSIKEPILALYVVGIGIGLQIIDEFIITPLVVGKAIDLKPLVIIGVVYLGGVLFGFWGLMFAIPVAAIAKIAYNVFLKSKREPEKIEEKETQEKIDGGEV
jgi:predicted PurR-regulated permease PerM